MDDSTGKACGEGPYPVLNTLKYELKRDVLVSRPRMYSKNEMVTYPRGFWSSTHKPLSSIGYKTRFQKFLYFSLFFYYYLKNDYL
jgi:hypothetical protein